MARKHFIVCDGCGEEQAIQTGDAMAPPAFVHCRVTVGTWGADVEVCNRCHDRLLEDADPRRWPRAKLSTERAA